MSGDGYFSGFGDAASGERDNHGKARDGHDYDRSRGRGGASAGSYRLRQDPEPRERAREPSFRELFGGGGRRGGRGRGRWRGQGSHNSRTDRRAPAGGYGGNRDGPSYGARGSSHDWNDAGGYGHRQQRDDRGRLGTGSGSWAPPPREDMRGETYSGTERPPSGSSTVQFFASARVPRPAPIDDNDENLTSRKKRKYVPGGRIGKYIKTQEFHTRSLYCDVCERDFYDENAKALHDRSKEHRDNQMRSRKSEEEATMSTAPEKEEKSAKKPVAISQDEIAAFVKEHATRWTRSFKGWANRSIEEAKKAAAAAKDHNIVASVQREILFEFRYHTDMCTMMQETWGRKPAASGLHYRQVQPSACTDRVFSEQEKRKMDEERRQALLAQPAAADSTVQETPAPSSTVSNAEAHNYFVRGQPMEIARPAGEVGAGVNLLGNDNVPESRKLVEMVDEGQHERSVAEQENYTPVTISWKLSRAATYLLACCKSVNSDFVGKNHRRAFPLLQENPEERSADDAVKKLVEKYNDLRSKYESQDFEYESWRRDLDEIVLGFKKRGTRIGSLKQCLHMQIDAAIYREDWKGCTASCNELMQFHNAHESWETGDGEYVGYWIMAGLLKSQNDSRTRPTPRAGYSGVFSLVTRLRELPCGVLGDMLVGHAVEVLKSVVCNNYWKFCELQADPLANVRTKGKFRYMMDELADVVRERGIVTMTMLSGISDEGCYSNPMAIDLEFVARTLKWGGETSEERSSEARSFIEGLPQGIRIDDTYPESMMLLASSKRAVLQRSDVVDVETLVKITPRAFAIV